MKRVESITVEVRCWDGDPNSPADLKLETALIMLEADCWFWSSVIEAIYDSLSKEAKETIKAATKDPNFLFNLEARR